MSSSRNIIRFWMNDMNGTSAAIADFFSRSNYRLITGGREGTMSATLFVSCFTTSCDHFIRPFFKKSFFFTDLCIRSFIDTLTFKQCSFFWRFSTHISQWQNARVQQTLRKLTTFFDSVKLW